MIGEFPMLINANLAFSPAGSGFRNFIAVREGKLKKVVSTRTGEPLHQLEEREPCTLLLYMPMLRAFWVPTRELIGCKEESGVRGLAAHIRKNRAERNRLGLRYSGSVVKEVLELLRGKNKRTAEEIADDEREAIDVEEDAVDENGEPATVKETAMEGTAATTDAGKKKPATKKTKTAKPAKAAKVAKPAKEKKVKAEKKPAKIKLLAKENPYRADTGIFKRFALITNGMTVDEFIDKVVKKGGTRGNATGVISNAVAGKYIELSE